MNGVRRMDAMTMENTATTSVYTIRPGALPWAFPMASLVMHVTRIAKTSCKARRGVEK